MLNYFLLTIFLILSFVDGYLTVVIRNKFGPDVEENPILRGLLRGKIYDFILFKLLDGFLLGFVFVLIHMKNEFIASFILVLCILVYIYVIKNNYEILKEDQSKGLPTR